MRGKSLALLLLALGCGLVASLGITQVLARRGDQSAPVDTVAVCVAKAEISPGSLANAENFKVEQWPKDKVPVGAVVRQEDVDGRRAKYKIFTGQPILEPMLMARGEVPMDAQIPKGLRVVAIAVGIEAIQGGLVVPGSRCDVQVFIRADNGLGIKETISKTILQNIRVFAVNDVTTNEFEDPKSPDKPHSIPSGKTVSLLVTPEQAETVTLASQLGTIRLVLRSAEDNEQVKRKPGVTASQMLDIAVGGGRVDKQADGDSEFNGFIKMMQSVLHGAAKPAPNKTVKYEEPARYTVRVRAGGDVTDVLMVANNTTGEGDDLTWTAANMPARSRPSSDSRMASPMAAPAAIPDGALSPKPQGQQSPVLKINTPPPLGG